MIMLKTPNRSRSTRQRRVILDELLCRNDHPTADELCEAVRKSLPRISLGTVYRNLDVLMRAGLVTRLEMAGTQARFDADRHPHYHVRCVSCGKVDDVLIHDLDGVSLPLLSVNGYSITGVRLEYDGLCPRCGTAAQNVEGGNKTQLAEGSQYDSRENGRGHQQADQ